MIFSVVVPTYNRPKLLQKCLKSLINQDYPKKDYEIIVVNNASSNHTNLIISSLMKQYKNIRFITNKTNKGPGYSRNRGIKKSKGKFIAFTDDDCVVDKDWLKKIEDSFKKSKVDAVGGSISNPTELYIAWAQYILNFSSWFPKGSDRYVKDIPTANIAYRRSVIINHFFPEHLSSQGYEDSIYNFHLYRNNKKILFCPKIKVEHFTWDENYGLKKFFKVQKNAAIGFVLGGYKVHSKMGEILTSFQFLNLFCPRLLMVFLRCTRYGYLTKFILCFPLILLGELYRGVVICLTNNLSDFK